MENLRLVLAGLDLGFEHVVMARIYLTHRRCPDRSGARQRRQAAWICRNKRPRALQRCSVVGISRISSRASPPTGPVRPMLPEASALEFSMKTRRGLRSPGGGADHAAEIAAPEGRILIRKNIGLHIAERRLRLVLNAVIEGLDDVLLEVIRTRVRTYDGLPLRIAVFGISQAKYVHFDARRQERDDRVHVLRDAGCCMQRDRCPDSVNLLPGDAVAT